MFVEKNEKGGIQLKIKKIMCCCGSGLGSGMLVRMNVEKALKEMGVQGVVVEHTSVSDAREKAADLFVVSKELEEFVSQLPKVVVLKDIMNPDELRMKLKEYFA